MNRTSFRWILASAAALAVALAGCSGLGGDVEEISLDACDDATHPIDVVTADLTGDGRDELVVSCQPISGGWDPGAVEVYTVDGDGFARAHSTTFDTAPASVAVGDLDADGIPDLVVSVSGSHERTLAVLLGDGDAGFVQAVDHVTPGELGRATLHDLTGNGALDAVMPDNNALLANDGTAEQPGPFTGEGLVSMDAMYDLSLADLDGDGRLDTAHVDQQRATIVVYPNEGTEHLEFPLPDDARDVHEVEAGGDLDDDGSLDLVVSTQTADLDSDVWLLLSDGADGWRASDPLDGLSGRRPAQVLATDLTGDGHLDLVKVPMAEPDEDDYELSILPGNGDGTFGEPDRIDVDGFPYRVKVSDLTGDGDDDLVFVRMDEDGNGIGVLRTDNGG